MLKQEEINASLIKNGFVVLDANLEQEIVALNDYILENYDLPESGFYYSLLNNNFETNKALSAFISKTLSGFYERTFNDYRIISESFLSKIANNKEEFYLHQDWNYTDEQSYNAYNIWIPLCDVTEENGTMFFIPGSHLWFQNYRSGSLPSSRLSYKHFPNEMIQKVEVKKGQVLLFHPAVFHGSFPNNTNSNRIIVTATVLPSQAPFLYYDISKTQADAINIHHLNDDIFLENLHAMAYGNTPGVPSQGSLPYQHKHIEAEEILSHYAPEN